VQRVVVRRAVIAPEAPVQTINQDVQEVQPKVHVDGIMMQGERVNVIIRGTEHLMSHRNAVECPASAAIRLGLCALCRMFKLVCCLPAVLVVRIQLGEPQEASLVPPRCTQDPRPAGVHKPLAGSACLCRTADSVQPSPLHCFDCILPVHACRLLVSPTCGCHHPPSLCHLR